MHIVKRTTMTTIWRIFEIPLNAQEATVVENKNVSTKYKQLELANKRAQVKVAKNPNDNRKKL